MAIEPLQTSINTLNTSLGTIKKEVASLTIKLEQKDEEIKELRTMVQEGLDEREQYSRRNNLRIFGVQETENEDTNELVIRVAKRVNVTLSVLDIDRSHRVGKVTAGGKPRAIIVKFVSYASRSAIFQAKKLLRNSGVTIREDLTKCRLQLLKNAGIAYSIKNVWSVDGVIFVKTSDARPFRLRTESDLSKLMVKRPPAQ